MAKRLKKYNVDVWAKYSSIISVKAKNKSEAKKIAIERFSKKKSNFGAFVDEDMGDL